MTQSYQLYSSEPQATSTDVYNFFDDWDESEKKKKKRKNNNKKKKKKKKDKKSKKSKKSAKQNFQYRLIEKSVNTLLNTASDIALIYAKNKFSSNHNEEH